MKGLPLFPLHTVLFPGMPLHLNIFEPRYLMMIRNCLELEVPFGVILIRKGQEALGPLAETYPVGCTARIIEIHPKENGHMDVTALGDERFRVEELDPSLPYLTGTVKMLRTTGTQSPEIEKNIEGLKILFLDYLKLMAKLGEAQVDTTSLNLPEDRMLLVYLAASMLQIPMIEKQVLLETSASGLLVRKINRLLRREMAILENTLEAASQKASRSAWLN